MHRSRLTMFIGSSVEGRSIAEALQLNLDYDLDCTIWHQGIFVLSRGTLESLVEIAASFDFATLVLTPDDLLIKRGRQCHAGRDNVIFELGLFMGALGPERTFLVHCRDTPIDLPTDLAGITAATFPDRDDLTAALGPVATQLRRHFDRLRERGDETLRRREGEPLLPPIFRRPDVPPERTRRRRGTRPGQRQRRRVAAALPRGRPVR